MIFTEKYYHLVSFESRINNYWVKNRLIGLTRVRLNWYRRQMFIRGSK